MKKLISTLWRPITSLLLTAALVLGSFGTASAAGAGPLSSGQSAGISGIEGIIDADNDGTINYVSLGASNANGYGLYGYLDDGIMADPVPSFKLTENVYGYLKTPAEGYPYLVKEALSETLDKDVNLTQLAISSMRAEELHMLLDNDYYGDAYTKWRFYNDNGAGWFAQAEPGGLSLLRQKYQDSIANADLVTVDIGVNNFGVYAINRITSYLNGGSMYDADFSNVFQGEDLEKFYSFKAEIMAAVKGLTGNISGDSTGQGDASGNTATEALIEHVVDTFAYALTGYAVNFDASLERIYALNPDVSVVVVSVQNLMHGLYATLDGETTLPLGEIYGAVVEMANLYTATMSPYCDRYNYAYAGQNGRAETFLDEIREYSGDPASLTKNMTDCFDVYDNNLWVRSRIQQMFVNYLIDSGYGSLITVSDAARNDLYTFMATVAAGGVKIGENTLQEFLAAGKAGMLTGDYLAAYQIYSTALNTAYDVVAKIMQAGALIDTIDISSLSNGYGEAQDVMLGYIADSVFDTVEKKLTDPSYEFRMSSEILANPVYCAVLAMGVRFDIGNSFYAHPNANGHQEIKTAIMAALKEDISGADAADTRIRYLLRDALQAKYVMTDDSYYVALGDAVADNSYVDRLAAELGLSSQITATAVNGLTDRYSDLTENGLTVSDMFAVVEANAETIAKADLITLSFNNNTLVTFMIDQMYKFMMRLPVAELDWALYVGEDGVADVEATLNSLRAELTKQGLDQEMNLMGMKLNVADLLMVGIESYAYRFIGQITTVPALIGTIQAISPDALVILVGMYNTLDGYSLAMGDTVLPLGEYVQYLVDVINLESLVYAQVDPNTIYVEIPDVETIEEQKAQGTGTNASSDVVKFILSMMRTGGSDLYPSLTENGGHEYIKNQIMNALTITEAEFCLLGDVNLDGAVNSADTNLLYRCTTRDTSLGSLSDLQLKVADINGDGRVNSSDTNLLYRYTSRDATLEWKPVEIEV